jgi:hypothetical protein
MPEAVRAGFGLSEKGADVALENAESLDDKAKQLRAWHRKSVPTANEVKLTETAGRILKLYGAVMAGWEGGKNFADCELDK